MDTYAWDETHSLIFQMNWEEFTAFLVDNYNQVFDETSDITKVWIIQICDA